MDRLVEDAEQSILKAREYRGGIWSVVTGPGRNEAVKLYEEAGEKFEHALKWKKAGDAFKEAAELENHQWFGNGSAANNYVRASACYRKYTGDPKEAINCLLKAIDIYKANRDLLSAISKHESIAEIYELCLWDFQRAIEHHTIVADYYQGEGKDMAASFTKLGMDPLPWCFYHIGRCAAKSEQYELAIEMYEKIPHSGGFGSSHLQYLCLCHICVDFQAAKNALEKYKNIYDNFFFSENLGCIKDLIASIEAQDIDGVEKAANKIPVSTLFRANVLSRIKKKMMLSKRKDEQERHQATACRRRILTDHPLIEL